MIYLMLFLLVLAVPAGAEKPDPWPGKDCTEAPAYCKSTVMVDAPPLVCLRKLREAVRSISPYVKRPVTPSQGMGGSLYGDHLHLPCWGGGCRIPTPPDMRSLEQRLHDEERAYARDQESRGYMIRDKAIEDWVFQNWEQVRKECVE